MQKYKLKKHEASMLADFLMPILKWRPSERPSAKQMLEHPWLSMPDDYNPKMSDLEYQKYQLIMSTKEQEEKVEKKMEAVFDDECRIGELVADQSEEVEADDEDNVSLDECSDDSVSLTGPHEEEEQEFQANVSFSGGYIPNTDLSRVDKGQGNPQFQGLAVN